MKITVKLSFILLFLLTLFSFTLFFACGDPPTVTELSATGQKTRFFLGEEFEVGDLKIKAIFSDQTEKDIAFSDLSIDSSSYQKDAVGRYKIIVSTSAYTPVYEYYVEVVAPKITSLIVSDTKTSFYLGDEFSCPDITVTASKENNTTEVLTSSDYVIDASLFDNQTEGTYEITVKTIDGTVSTSFNVQVVRPKIVSIALSETKTSFFVEDEFDCSTLVVTASKENNTSTILTAKEYSVDFSLYNKDIAGTYTITVTTLIDNVSNQYSVDVVDPLPVSLELKDTFTKFDENEEFTVGKLTVTVIFENGKTETLSTADYTVDSSLFDSSANGFYEIKVSVEKYSLSTSYSVEVKKLSDQEKQDREYSGWYN